MKRVSWYLVSIMVCAMVSSISMAQGGYDVLWKNVVASENAGGYKSLKPQIDLIFNKAVAEKNTPQKLKSLLYLAKIEWLTGDETIDKIATVFKRFEDQVSSSSGIEKALFQTYLAKFYSLYAANTYWERERITSLEQKPADFRTWSNAQFQTTIIGLFDDAIANKQLLQKDPIGQWAEITTTPDTDQLCPTLYDLVAKEYLTYLVQKPYGFTDKEMLINKSKIESIYQSLFDLNQNRVDKTAYLRSKCDYFSYLYQDNHPQLNRSLTQLIDQNIKEPYTAMLLYFLTEQLGREDRVEKHRLCTRALKEVPNSKWNILCNNLLRTIEESELTLNYGFFQLPNTPIALEVTHRNVDAFKAELFDLQSGSSFKEPIFENAYSLDNDLAFYEKNETWQSKKIDTKTFKLNPFSDYNDHKTVVNLGSLPKGVYRLVNSIEESKQIITSQSTLFVTTLFHVKRINNKGNVVIQFLDLGTGKAISNQTVKIYVKREVPTTRKKQWIYLMERQTDSAGCIELDGKKSEFSSSLFQFPTLKEWIGFINHSYERTYSNTNDERNHTSMQLFTDRAIYRPGQKLFFKGVVRHEKGNSRTVIPNYPVTLNLHNVNDEVVSTLALKSNEYGSIFGEFILPSSGLTGTYALRDDAMSSYHSIQVEEYKRPKFEVLFDTLKTEYVLEQNVEVTGNATAFSGAAISNAPVTYSVTREETFLWRPYSWGMYYPTRDYQNEMIAQGELVTNEKGQFRISFNAKSKTERTGKNYRSYQYIVSATVVDVNGETHEANTTLTIGDLPSYLNLLLPSKVPQRDLTSIHLKSQTLNGQKHHAKGVITITKMEEENRVLLPNARIYTDYQLYDYKTYVSYFPYLPYKNQNKSTPQFEKGAKVLETSFDTQKSDSVVIKQLDRGFYLVQAYSLFGQDTIQTYQMVEVLDNVTGQSSNNQFFTYQLDKPVYRVGDQAILHFRSDLQTGYVNVYQERQGQLSALQQIPIINGIGTLTFTITETDLVKGLFLKADFVHSTDFKTQMISIPVIEKIDRKLTFQTKVFRNKIEPGIKESWELIVTGPDKEKFTAEVLATMYDASLDQFAANTFNYDLDQESPQPRFWSSYSSGYYENLGFGSLLLKERNKLFFNRSNHQYQQAADRLEPLLNSFGFSPWERSNRKSGSYAIMDEVIQMSENRSEKISYSITAAVVSSKADAPPPPPLDLSAIKVRTNLQETAFFYPNLYTDANGNVKFTFTTPEALTKWKLLLFAHTPNLKFGTGTFYTQTQKELMVTPNVPRFLREGDQISISSKIDNLSNKQMNGTAQLLLYDAISKNSIDSLFDNARNTRAFTAEKGANTAVNWNLKIPANVHAVIYRVVAQAGTFSDGEESVLPILTNRMMVTETLPISIKENQNKVFTLDKLIHNNSTTLQNFNLTLEFTANPLWLAVTSLPYLREYPYECSEQLFSRLYGNMLSSYILQSSPKIKRVFDEWGSKGLTLSNLEKNPELKSIILEETPWLREAQNENEQQKRMAVLFDLNQMASELDRAQDKLIKRQNSNGSFAWFEGGQESTYITSHLVAGFGKLRNLLGTDAKITLKPELLNLIHKSVQYIDQEALKQIKKAKEHKVKLTGATFAHYFYVRSFWLKEYPIPSQLNGYLGQIVAEYAKEALTYPIGQQALTATLLKRYGYGAAANKIVYGMKERSIESNEMGMYWKENQAGYRWYEAPIETQASIIEAFAEITPTDEKSIEEMKVWLLKNRQSNAWPSTKSTTEAVYALVHHGKSWINAEKGVTLQVGSKQIYPTSNNTSNTPTDIQATSGYIKQSWKGAEITPEMGTVTISKNSPGVAYGGLYWQYLEQLDRITAANSDVKITKQLFVKTNTDDGSKLVEITTDKPLNVGDLVTVRLVIQTYKEMEYIHIKDMNASGFEPTDVLSSYKYQNSLGYYQSTKDASTNFFIDTLPRGTYVFEYTLRANNAGEFSNGITSLQNMYAPEMAAHSEGIRVKIETK